MQRKTGVGRRRIQDEYLDVLMTSSLAPHTLQLDLFGPGGGAGDPEDDQGQCEAPSYQAHHSEGEVERGDGF